MKVVFGCRCGPGDPQDGQHGESGDRAGREGRGVHAHQQVHVQEHGDQVPAGTGVRRGDPGRPQGEEHHHAGRQQTGPHSEGRRQGDQNPS